MFFSEPEPSASSRLVGVDKDKLRLTAKGCVTADGWWISDIHRAREYLVRSTRTSTKSPSPFSSPLSCFNFSCFLPGSGRHAPCWLTIIRHMQTRSMRAPYAAGGALAIHRGLSIKEKSRLRRQRAYMYRVITPNR